MIKILTNNGIDNTNIDGARANNFNSGGQSGIVKGAFNEGKFFAISSNIIALTSCELRVSGHRIIIDEILTKSLTSQPQANQRLSMIAQIIVANEVVSFSTFLQNSSTVLIQDNLYSTNGDGTYQLEIGRFTQTTQGTIVDIVRTVDTIVGGSGGNNQNWEVGEVTTIMLAPELPANVDIDFNEETRKYDFNFDIPKGDTGLTPNITATVVYEPKITPEVTRSGTNQDPILEFKLPQYDDTQIQQIVNSANTKATTAVETATESNTKSDKAITDSSYAVDVAELVRTEFNQVIEQELSISQDINSTETITAPSSAIVKQALADLTQAVTPVNQSAEVIHLEGTSAGYVDKLVMSSEPRQDISANLYNGRFKTFTESGVTVTQKEDGRLILDGTATARIVKGLPQTDIIYPAGTTMIMGKLILDKKINIEYVSVMTDGSEEYYPRSNNIPYTFVKSIVKQRIFLIIDSGAAFYSENIYPMLNLGTTLLPYQPYTGQPSPDNPIAIDVVSSPVEIVSDNINLLPYNATSTSIPLVTTSGETVELLGEYNTKTNVLSQKWKKDVFDGSFCNISIGSEINVIVLRLPKTSKRDPLFICNKGGRMDRSIGTISNYWGFLPNLYKADVYELQNTLWYGVPKSIDTPLKAAEWLSTNQLTIYYELATPEILTMQPLTPEQKPKTLDGETNIYATNNASPITFDVTELLVSRERANIVLEDKDNVALMPFTIASQVEVDSATGTMLEMEIEAIEASISDSDIALANEKTARETADNEIITELGAEIAARTNGDAAVRNELTDGSLIPDRAKGIVGTAIITNREITGGNTYIEQLITSKGTYGDLLILKGNVKITDPYNPMDPPKYSYLSGLYVSSPDPSPITRIILDINDRTVRICVPRQLERDTLYTIEGLYKLNIY